MAETSTVGLNAIFVLLNLYYIVTFLTALHRDVTASNSPYAVKRSSDNTNNASRTQVPSPSIGTVARKTFPQISMRIGLALALLTFVLSLDPTADYLYPVWFISAASIAINCVMFALAGQWLSFHYAALRKQMGAGEVSAAYSRLVQSVGPVVYVVVAMTGLILVYATDRVLWSVLTDGAVTIFAWTYVGTAIYTYAGLRSALRQFMLRSGSRATATASAAPPQPGRATNGSAQQPQQPQQLPGGQVSGAGGTIDTTHIQRAIRRMSFFITLAFVLPFVFSFLMAYVTVGDVTDRYDDPAPTEVQQSEGVYLAIVVNVVIVGANVWYVYPWNCCGCCGHKQHTLHHTNTHTNTTATTGNGAGALAMSPGAARRPTVVRGAFGGDANASANASANPSSPIVSGGVDAAIATPTAPSSNVATRNGNGVVAITVTGIASPPTNGRVTPGTGTPGADGVTSPVAATTPLITGVKLDAPQRITPGGSSSPTAVVWD